MNYNGKHKYKMFAINTKDLNSLDACVLIDYNQSTSRVL